MRALTARQARFVDEYLIDLNATRPTGPCYGCSRR